MAWRGVQVCDRAHAVEIVSVIDCFYTLSVHCLYGFLIWFFILFKYFYIIFLVLLVIVVSCPVFEFDGYINKKQKQMNVCYKSN